MTTTLERPAAHIPIIRRKHSTRRLIINADGYGFTPGVNTGIVKTFELGMIKSTSCTPNFGFLSEAGTLARKFPEVSFGIHFNLSVGAPLSDPNDIPTLVGKDGRFLGPELLGRLCRGRVRFTDLVRELTAQAAILADQGVKVSHWDGHQNKHLWPLYFEAGCEVAKRFGIRGIRSHRRVIYTARGPITRQQSLRFYPSHPATMIAHLGGRLRTTQASRRGFVHADSLISPGYLDNTDKYLKHFWETLAHTLPEGTHEVYCHPAEPDDLLRANATYVEQRANELKVLSDPALPSLFADAGIDLINFHMV
jgi:predicted glycoside hydrolase/deacetylase ChbG (UPF0249 family)